MPDVTYENDITGLVVIDPYNDFISEGGKVWDRLKGVAEANGASLIWRPSWRPRGAQTYECSMRCITDTAPAISIHGST